MKTLVLLIVLTQNGAGDINASFVNTETQEQCQQKAFMLESVFKASDIPIIESRCIQSNLKFSKFDHASTSNMIRYFYLIESNEETVVVNAMENWNTCNQQEKDHSGSGAVYCVGSVQSIN